MSAAQASPQIRLVVLSRAASTEIDFTPDPERLAAWKDALGLLALRKMRLRGTLAPVGQRDWRLSTMLGATAVQPCSVTLEPVTTRIDEPLERYYLADFAAPQESEAEMPEDDTAEPLPETLDLAALAEEALALALPAFPRAPGVEFGDITAAPPGAAPLDTADLSPFAELDALKRKLEG